MANALNIITGNSLGEGLVVFQTPGGGWSLDIGHAEVLETPEALATATSRANADATANRVVEPYAIEVTRNGPRLVPVRLREQIRADGPTVGHSKDKDSAVSEEAA
jgi:hypothetical protein